MLLWPKKKVFSSEGCSPIDVQHPTLTVGEIKQFIADIPCRAELHRRHIENAFQISMDYSAASIGDLEELIARNWPKAPPHMAEMVPEFACYLGQTIRRNHGGEWGYCVECGWTLGHIGGQNLRVFPFEKIRRRFLFGKEEALDTYYSFLRCQLQNKQDNFESPYYASYGMR